MNWCIKSISIVGLMFMILVSPHRGWSSNAQSYHVEFSEPGGFYTGEVMLELLCDDARIYYTVNGETPTTKSRRYRVPLKISQSVVIRAIAVKKGKKGPVITHSYFLNEQPSTIPVVSLTFPPKLLFDREKGLYMRGVVNDTVQVRRKENFWSRKEVRINTEIFETDGSCVFNSQTGLRLFGGMSRLKPQKSLAIIARDRYGKKRIEHPIFGDHGKKKFKYLVLRNSGTDWGQTHFRDALMTGLVEDWDLETQDYRPAHVYINGYYWGIYNIREKINSHYIKSHFKVEKDSIDLLQHKWTLRKGSRKDYLRLLRFLRKNDFSKPEVFAELQQMMDVNNFMHLMIAQIYGANMDAGGNIKFWKEKSADGRWRWILYDTDFSFGMYDEKSYASNSIDFFTEENGPKWPNPPWSTFMLRKLLENEEFELDFITAFCDYLNTDLSSENVLDEIEDKYESLIPEYDRHLKRWKLRKAHWEHEIEVCRNFARYRPDYMRVFLKEEFGLNKESIVNINKTENGIVIVNERIELDSTTNFSGTYFKGLPLQLKAIPDYGYVFSHWEGIEFETDQAEIMVFPSANEYTLRPVFKKYLHPLQGQIVINEVFPCGKPSGDWIELYNRTDQFVNLKDWVVGDAKKELILPEVDIEPFGYIILAENYRTFSQAYPKCTGVVGDFPIKISKKKENLYLLSDNRAPIDFMHYDMHDIDTTYSYQHIHEPGIIAFLGTGTMEVGYGTPGQENPRLVVMGVDNTREVWIRMGIGFGSFTVAVILTFLVLSGSRISHKKRLQLSESKN